MVPVYGEAPAADSPPAWFQIIANPTTYMPLDKAYDAESGYFWRGVYSSNLWLDANHVAPGVGYVGLMCCADSGSRFSSAAVVGDRPYNLIGGRFRVDIRANPAAGGLRLGKDVRLIFWIQFRDPTSTLGEGRYVNLGYVGQTVDRLLGFTAPFERGVQETKSSPWVRLSVPFDPSATEDWIHYGSRAEKAHIYETDADHRPDAIAHLFRFWNWNLGIHALYGPTPPLPGDLPWGHLNFRNFSLEVDESLNTL